MATIGLTWAMVFRCHKCRWVFTVRGIPPAGIADAADISKCPQCGSNSDTLKGTSRFGHVRNLIVNVERERR